MRVVGIGLAVIAAACSTTVPPTSVHQSIIASPWRITDQPPIQGGTLFDVTCPSSNRCWAVGMKVAGSYSQALIDGYDGAGWSVVGAPPIPGGRLFGVACESGSACWAVGSVVTTARSQPLIEQDTGTGWIAVPNAAADGYLGEVACPASSDCWAVGSTSENNGIDQPLIEHFDGVGWVVAQAHALDGDRGALESVACAAPDDCWSVGDGGSQATPHPPLIEHYDGSSWVTASSPTVATTGGGGGLRAVTCPHRDDCWAVGTGADSDAAGIIEHNNGGGWKASQAPALGGQGSGMLGAVACVTPAYCAIAGSDTRTPSQPLILRYASGAWATAASPIVPQGGWLSGIACTRTACWAVGALNIPATAASRSLIETSSLHGVT